MRLQVTLSAFVFAASCLAANGAWAQAAPPQQSSSTSSSQASADSQVAENSAATPATAPTKKVWTNDDVGGLRGTSPISTVGVANSKPQKQPAAKAMPTANPETIRSYHDRIVALQRQLPEIDTQISDLQGALNGQTVNSTRHVGAKIDDWHDELTRALQKKTDLETRISVLQDEARHKGVPENQIPE